MANIRAISSIFSGVPQPKHVDNRILNFVANPVLPDQNSPYLAQLELEQLLADTWVGQHEYLYTAGKSGTRPGVAGEISLIPFDLVVSLF